jgi:SAM-dependent methyltransferase
MSQPTFGSIDAAFHFFAVFRKRPLATLWLSLWSVVPMAALHYSMLAYLPEIVLGDPTQLSSRLPMFGLFWLGGMISMIAIYAAWLRLLVRDEPLKLVPIGIGGDEWRLLATAFLWTFMFMGFGLVFMLGLGIVGGGAIMMLGEGATAALSIVLGLLIFPLYFWLIVRLYPVYALSILDRKIVGLSGWGASRGVFWPALGALAIMIGCFIVIEIVLALLLMPLLLIYGPEIAAGNVPDFQAMLAEAGPLTMALLAAGMLILVWLIGFAMGPSAYMALWHERRRQALDMPYDPPAARRPNPPLAQQGTALDIAMQAQEVTMKTPAVPPAAPPASASSFVGNIPQNYDEGLGPHIFIDYAQDIAARAAKMGGEHVLELAAGTGIVSRELRNALPAESDLLVTDLNPPMLTIASKKFKDGEGVSFRPVDAMNMPLDDASSDLVVCQFGVMFFPDKIASFRETRRVLRAGGHYLFNVWGAIEANPFSQVASDTAAAMYPDDPPGFYKVPFGYHDIEQVTSDLTEAGFVDIRHQVVTLDKTVKDWALFARGLVLGNPLIDEIRERGGHTPEDAMQRLTAALIERFGEAPSAMPLEAIVFEAKSP